jgi:hypothetical protein
LNAENHKAYRVITGYDEDALIEPDYNPAANGLNPVKYEDIEFVYIWRKDISKIYIPRCFKRYYS